MPLRANVTPKVSEYLHRLDNGLRTAGTRLRGPHMRESDIPHGARYFLAAFDQAHGPALEQEATRFLADGGATLVANQTLPVGWQRAIIREALSDLTVLDLVQTLVDPAMQATIQIPYEYRKMGTIINSGMVFEGGEIPRASIEQRMDLAYIVPAKLSMEISNEIAFFSASYGSDWEILARNIASNSRLMASLIARRISNEFQRSSDAFQAEEVADEDVSDQLDGSTSLIKTARFPLVRPHQVYDLAGSTIGDRQNPLTLTLDGDEIAEWSGVGGQAPGLYYAITSCNLGFIRLVDQDGEPQSDLEPTTATLSYSAATNCDYFDLSHDPAEISEGDHLNGALRKFGERLAFMRARRFALPEFALMGALLASKLSDASQFTAASTRAGTSLAPDGALGEIKRVPCYESSAQSDLEDSRIQFAETGTLTYAIAKPWSSGPTFELTGPNGLPVGIRSSYAEEYSTVYVPPSLRYQLTALIVYNSVDRDAAV
jgi:hypothetical protein